MKNNNFKKKVKGKLTKAGVRLKKLGAETKAALERRWRSYAARKKRERALKAELRTAERQSYREAYQKERARLAAVSGAAAARRAAKKTAKPRLGLRPVPVGSIMLAGLQPVKKKSKRKKKPYRSFLW